MKHETVVPPRPQVLSARQSRGRRLIRLTDAALYLDQSPRTVRRRIAEGVLRGYKIGKSRLVLVDLDEVEEQLRPIPTRGGDAAWTATKYFAATRVGEPLATPTGDPRRAGKEAPDPAKVSTNETDSIVITLTPADLAFVAEYFTEIGYLAAWAEIDLAEISGQSDACRAVHWQRSEATRTHWHLIAACDHSSA